MKTIFVCVVVALNVKSMYIVHLHAQCNVFCIKTKKIYRSNILDHMICAMCLLQAASSRQLEKTLVFLITNVFHFVVILLVSMLSS